MLSRSKPMKRGTSRLKRSSIRPSTFAEAVEKRPQAAQRREKGIPHYEASRCLNTSQAATGLKWQGVSRKPRKALKAKPDPRLAIWTKAVKERDGNQCQAQSFSGRGAYEFTGLRCSGPLDAHHIAERSLRPDLKYELSNGIALCRRHHDWIPLNRAEAVRIGLLSDETYEKAQKMK